MPDTDQDQDHEPGHGPNLILDVENFGPIAEAKNIEFRPMTVFVGPSNTGKSYLAMLLHAMLQARQNRQYVRTVPYLRRLMPQGAGNDVAAIFEETVELLMNTREYDSESSRVNISIDKYSAAARSQIFELLDQRKRDIAESFVNEITEFFEVRHLNDLRRGSGRTGDIMSIQLGDVDMNWYVKPGLETFTDSDDLRLTFHERFLTRLIEGDVRDRFTRRSITQYVLDTLETKFHGILDSLYFPAARTGILMTHRATTSSLIERAHWSGVEHEEKPSPTYHRIARDFLRLINDVVDAQRYRRNRSSGQIVEMLASRIEESLLRGRIRVEDAPFGPPEFEYQPDQIGDLRVPMYRASSMVTEIAPIVAFLRAYVDIGDLLIVEEPEAHLHPAAQQKMAAMLAYLVRQGIRVMITTHSHYMVEAMGMFVCASGIGDNARVRSMGELIGEHGDDRGDIRHELYLNEDEVAVYGFKERDETGTVVEPIRFDPESYSYSPEDYSVALLDQFNRISRVINERIDADELAANA